MKRIPLLKSLLIWRLRHVSNEQFVMFLSVIIGFLSALAAIIIKNAVHSIQFLLHYGLTKEYENYLYFIYPAIGITIAVLFIKFVIRHPVRHGIPNVLHAISKKNGRISRHNMFSSIITSAFTVGFGGSVGLEGPTVATGAALGSNIGQFARLNYKQTILLLGCACTGAMAAIFKAPIAAVVFALEVIMLDLTMSAVVPLLMSSVTAALTSYFFLGQDVIYSFEVKESFHLADIPFFIILGVITGIISVYFTKMYMFVGKFFKKVKSTRIKLLIGSIALGVLIFLLPSLYGEGYDAINSCLHGDYTYLFNNSLYYDYKDNFWIIGTLLILVILFKVVATSVTFGSGGVGGIFAPTLFMGANTGLLFALIINFLELKHLCESNFALVGMAGMIAGVLHAPLTAIFLIADLTSGYQLFMPLMITSTISYATVRYFVPNSVYTLQLAQRKELITHHKDKAVLSLMNVKKLIETNFIKVHEDMTLGDLVKDIAKSHRNIFPVVDEANNLLGIVRLDDIRQIMFDHELYDKYKVSDLMISPDYYVTINDLMEDVAKKFQESGKFNIPVISNGKYLGFISRANVFSAYRKLLKEFSEH